VVGMVVYVLCQGAADQGKTLYPFLIMTPDGEPDPLLPLS